MEQSFEGHIEHDSAERGGTQHSKGLEAGECVVAVPSLCKLQDRAYGIRRWVEKLMACRGGKDEIGGQIEGLTRQKQSKARYFFGI